jgi:hypothetical protein
MSDSDSLANTANRLSLGAAILAAGAFLVAFLQAVLEYSSSGAERDKCTECAIHIAKKMSYRRWPWEWKWRYYYPELDFRANAVLGQLVVTSLTGIQASFLREIVRIEGNGWMALEPDNVPKSGCLQ